MSRRASADDIHASFSSRFVSELIHTLDRQRLATHVGRLQRFAVADYGAPSWPTLQALRAQPVNDARTPIAALALAACSAATCTSRRALACARTLGGRRRHCTKLASEAGPPSRLRRTQFVTVDWGSRVAWRPRSAVADTSLEPHRVLDRLHARDAARNLDRLVDVRLGTDEAAQLHHALEGLHVDFRGLE